jgi:TorA maturation chaperone TorD
MNITMVNEDKRTGLAGEILTLGLYGKLLYQYPDVEFYRQLFEEAVFEDIPFGNDPSLSEGIALIQNWSAEHPVAEGADWFESLLEDYTRLFIGPDKVLAPPWESVFVQEGRLVFTETTLNVRHFYRRFGFELENLHKEPDDHIGLELVFLSNLANLALQTLETGQSEEYQRYVQAQADFYQAHLGRWAMAFFNQLFDYARTDFYRGLARLCRSAIEALEDRFA